jgi:hypothetical protein
MPSWHDQADCFLVRASQARLHGSGSQLKAAMPVMARPKISAWMSCVPS